jgi:hypothetical protein
MGLRFWLFVLATAALAHAMFYLADREISAGVDRLSEAKLARPDALDADPELKMVSAKSAYVRDER